MFQKLDPSRRTNIQSFKLLSDTAEKRPTTYVVYGAAVCVCMERCKGKKARGTQQSWPMLKRQMMSNSELLANERLSTRSAEVRVKMFLARVGQAQKCANETRGKYIMKTKILMKRRYWKN